MYLCKSVKTKIQQAVNAYAMSYGSSPDTPNIIEILRAQDTTQPSQCDHTRYIINVILNVSSKFHLFSIFSTTCQVLVVLLCHVLKMDLIKDRSVARDVTTRQPTAFLNLTVSPLLHHRKQGIQNELHAVKIFSCCGWAELLFSRTHTFVSVWSSSNKIID